MWLVTRSSKIPALIHLAVGRLLAIEMGATKPHILHHPLGMLVLLYTAAVVGSQEQRDSSLKALGQVSVGATLPKQVSMGRD